MNMEDNTQNQDHAYHGSDWAEHEDFLVGNKEGLEKLQSAINEALDKGESSIDSGEFIGVRCLDTEFFENQTSQVKPLSNFIGWSVVAAVALTFAIGIKTIISWVLG